MLYFDIEVLRDKSDFNNNFTTYLCNTFHFNMKMQLYTFSAPVLCGNGD